ncbi:MAG: polysulfide reductase NrfD [Bacteroidetes bacterium]|nr:polysulfide reductase NrfD [Bacteroidota bacterium]
MDQIINDLSHHIRLNKGFFLWMGFLALAFLACLYAYIQQLRYGLGVAGIRDYISWGLYISNFVFFVASSLIGMLISAVLGLIGLAYVFLYARFQSPILWDVTVITTYFVISLLLLFLPMIPDMAVLYKRFANLPSWLKPVYKVLSLNWTDHPEQNRIIHRSIYILLILIIPAALSIHTVTSWLFALTVRPGWDSTIFGPYFVSGAFVAGSAAVIIAMFFFRKNYKLQDYLTDLHFNNMGKVLVLVAFVYLYFNINEYLVPGYKLKRADAVHLKELMSGHFALTFWLVQVGGLLIPIVLMLFRKMRKPLPLTLISIVVLIAAWFKRYLIVVPAMAHPFLPVQHVPDNFKVYSPTLIEIAITLLSFILVLIIITLISKFFPVIPVVETAKEKGLDPLKSNES